MSEFAELLLRVESASGPDRELDARILCVLLAPAGSKVEQSSINHAWCVYEPRAYGKEPFALWSTPSPFRQIPLTESIDAAVALCERVLPGWKWYGGWSATGRVFASIASPTMEIIRVGASEKAIATPALALCAAILKVKIAEALRA